MFPLFGRYICTLWNYSKKAWDVCVSPVFPYACLLFLLGVTCGALSVWVYVKLKIKEPSSYEVVGYIEEVQSKSPNESMDSPELTPGSNLGLISINNSSKSQLESLPGIGSVLAERIISSRPFTNLDDLKKVSGISEKLFSKLNMLIRL